MRPYIICHMMSLLDGRKGMASVFDGLDADFPPTKLQLVSVEMIGETIWAKYKL